MSSDLRKRNATANGKSTNPDKLITTTTTTTTKTNAADDLPPLSTLDIIRIIVGLLLLNSLLSYFITTDSFTWGYKPWFIRPAVFLRYLKGPIILTDADLLLYNGDDPSLPVYLALNGTIYDVSASRYIYGPGGSYHVFAGKDAARGFITGCFAEDATPDLRGVEWTYMPADITNPEFPEEEEVKEGKKEKRKEDGAMKNRRALELRKARKEVAETLEGWAATFRGETGKDYFEVGRVKRERGWLEALPKRKLCAEAQKGRPQPGTEAQDAGAMHRGQ